MNDNFKYYGFYGNKGKKDEINKRTDYQELSLDPQVNNKEFGIYVHNFTNDNIIEHLKKEGDITLNNVLYSRVSNLTFVPKEGLDDKEIKEVQDLINTSYSLYLNKTGDKISWAKLHALIREYIYSGYDSKLSEDIVNLYAKKAEEELKNNIFDDDKKKFLEIQSKRTCDIIHTINNHNDGNKQINNTDIILQDYIIKDNERQFILGGNDEIKDYKNNPKALVQPFIKRDINLGFFAWNLMINKAIVKCIFDNSDLLFPIQIILGKNPNFLFFEQIDINNEDIQYIGYFIARIDLDILKKPSNSKGCERLYDYKNDRIPESKQQYFVLFIFKNKNSNVQNITDKYILTDFRLQRVHWGNLTRSKRVLFIEIQQLMCSLLNENENREKAYFYLLSEYQHGQNESINIKCKSQYDEINKINEGKEKDNKDCYEAWLHKTTFDLLNKKNIKLINKSYNVFIAKKKIKELHDELNYRNKDKSDEILFFINNDKDFEHIDVYNIKEKKQYILFPCHFKWETIINEKNEGMADRKYGNKKTFVLKHGYLDLKTNVDKTSNDYYDSVEYYQNELCLKGNCIYNRDFIMNTFNNINLYNNNLTKLPNEYLKKLEELQKNLLLTKKDIEKSKEILAINLENLIKRRFPIEKIKDELKEKNIYLTDLNILSQILERAKEINIHSIKPEKLQLLYNHINDLNLLMKKN
jgi:hypothetical protein